MVVKSWIAAVSLSGLMMSGLVAADNVRVPLIAGGNYASISDAPWQVYFDTKFGSCGGVIISSNYVLTAAHCVVYLSPSDITAYAGIGDLQKRPGNGIAVSSIITHPSYDGTYFTADIALLKLSGTLPSNAKPIPLIGTNAQINVDSDFQAATEDNIYISGWGSSTGKGKLSRYLKSTHLNGIADRSCSWNYKSNGQFSQFFADALICGNQKKETGICAGDSGGPLVWQNSSHASDADKGYRLIGLASFGKNPCGSPDNEDAFTQISTYREWISKNMVGGYKKPSVIFSNNIFKKRPTTTTPPTTTPPTTTPPTTTPGVAGGSIGGFSLFLMGILWMRRYLT